jgi:release factor glutamine methyltransferase
LATRHPNNFQKEIRWLIEEKYGGNSPAGGVEAEKDIARLEKGEHIDYVMGWVDFAGCRIDLSKRPLIPRPETEYWIEKVIEELRRQKSSRNQAPYSSLRSSPRPNPMISRAPSPSLSRRPRVLDVFAGSGCIGIAVLKHVPLAKVDFAEKEKKLFKQIQINAKLNGIDVKRYRVLQSDIFSNIKAKYDYIFANPPYVAEVRKAKVQKSVLDQEPHSAIFGGKDGLYYIRKFLKEARVHLNPNGKMYMEFDSLQKQAIAKLLKQLGYTRFDFFKDQYDKWRYARIIL